MPACYRCNRICRRWALFPRGSFTRGHFWPGAFLSGRAFVRGAYAVPPNFNAYTHAPSRLSVPSMIYVYPAGGRIQLTS